MRPFVPVAVLCALCPWMPAQGGGPRLSFAGTGVLGERAGIRVRTGPPLARVAVVLSPRLGSYSAGGFETRCMAPAPGLLALTIPTSSIGEGVLSFVVPRDPALVGVYLAAQAFAPGPPLRASNCASFIVASNAARLAVTETFDDREALDRAATGARWGDPVAGAVLPGRLGGEGILGDFDHRLGRSVGGAFVFDTDRHVFPATATLTGRPITVTDGVFRFRSLHVPKGVTVRFTGSKPVRLLVAGEVRVAGTLDASAPPMPLPDGKSVLASGQPGGPGGPGGGRGGNGGDTPAAAGARPDGGDGEDLRLPASSPHRGREKATGGGGSAAVPPGADPTKVRYAFAGFYCNQMAGPGGAGGFAAAGGPGRVLAERAPGGETGAPGRPGTALVVLPTGRAGSRAELLVGGSGGGGAGAHPYDSVRGRPIVWARGSGGAGGGGAILIAAGGDVVVEATGKILAEGGSTPSRTEKDGLLLAPGGPGSGGAILIQTAGRFTNAGLVSAAGGRGGRTEDTRITPGTRVAAGDGAPGIVRIESDPPPTRLELGRITPPPGRHTVGLPVENDPRTLASSRWRRLPAEADPTRQGYEVYTQQGARSVVYSNRPSLGVGPLRLGVTPVALFVRYGKLDATGRLVPGSAGAWGENGAAAPAGSNAVQFALVLDTGLAGAAAAPRVDTVRITF